MQTKAIYHIFGKTEGFQFCTKVLLFVELFLLVFFLLGGFVCGIITILYNINIFFQISMIHLNWTRTIDKNYWWAYKNKQGTRCTYTLHYSGKIFHGKEFWRHMLCKQKKNSRRLQFICIESCKPSIT